MTDTVTCPGLGDPDFEVVFEDGPNDGYCDCGLPFESHGDPEDWPGSLTVEAAQNLYQKLRELEFVNPLS